ncbi:MAG TPA: helix-turn-helix transcriptional regulator [Symbiobacteriaceae bacterium]|jgi:hypothetical protein
MPLTQAQIEEIRQVAKEKGYARLKGLSERWEVPFQEVARQYAAIVNSKSTPGPAAELTADQLREVRRLAQAGESTRLFLLAEEWGIEYRVLSKHYTDFRAVFQNGNRTGQNDARSDAAPPALNHQRPDDWRLNSPVGNVAAEPGQIAVLPRNWPLITARLATGSSPREIALAVGMTGADYQRVEEGRQLPTPDQAARLCALLGLQMEETFVAAGPEPLMRRGPIRSLSLLSLLRARRRLSIRDLAHEVSAGGEVRVTEAFISQVERNSLMPGRWPDQAGQVRALAHYFGVEADMVTAQVPPSWIQAVSSGTRQMHSVLKAELAQLSAGQTAMDPELLTAVAGGGK